MDMMAVTTYFVLFPTPQNSFTFSLSFEGDILNHHLHNAEMVSMLHTHNLSESSSVGIFLDSH
jgi:hypothetical protein